MATDLSNFLSRDMWIASSACHSTCAGTGNFDSTKSSTFKNTNKSFSVTYNKGYAEGTMGQDVVQMAGFTISDQEFGKCRHTILLSNTNA
jgi:cathepsin D